MSDRIKKLKIKKQDGTFSDYIPLGADAENIDTTDGESVQLKLNKKPYYYNSVADMKADTKLKAGDMAITLGYYEANDGGGAFYKICNEINNTYMKENLSNGLFAEIIIQDSQINIKQLGATIEQDLKPFIERYLNITTSGKIKLYIPYGYWKCSEIILNKWFNIIGENVFCGNTTISPLNSNQDFIFKIYNDNEFTKFWNLESLNFQSAEYDVGSCLIIEHVAYGYVNNISFQNVRGQAILFKQCWEITFTNLIARHVIPLVHGENFGIFQFDNSGSGNISTLYFNYIQLEANIGNVFVLNNHVGIYNNHIGTINIEGGPYTTGADSMVQELQMTPTNTSLLNPANHFAIFKLLDTTELGGLSINTIDTNNLASTIFNYQENDYIFDSIFYKKGSSNTLKNINIQLNSINFVGLGRDIQILNVNDGNNNIVDNTNVISINNVSYIKTDKKAYFNCKTENNINVPSLINPMSNEIKIPENLSISRYCNNIPSNRFGLLKYDKDALSSNKLVVYPFMTLDQDSGFKLIATSDKLKLYVKSTSTTSIKVKDLNNDNNTLYTINSTDGKYIWITIDLSRITDFEIGDELLIGVAAGWSVSFDCFSF